jgi:hypothetical protein
MTAQNIGNRPIFQMGGQTVTTQQQSHSTAQWSTYGIDDDLLFTS